MSNVSQQGTFADTSGNSVTRIVVPGTSPGLVSAAGLPGNTTGSAIAAGYVGQIIIVNPSSSVSLSNSITYLATINLTAGVWLLSGMVEASPTVTSSNTWIAGISSSSSSFDSSQYVASNNFNNNTAYSNIYTPTPLRYVTTSTSVPYYLVSQVGTSSVAGTWSTNSYIQAIRIA